MERQGRDLEPETKKKLRNSSMVLETIPDKNFGTNWKLREQ